MTNKTTPTIKEKEKVKTPTKKTVIKKSTTKKTNTTQVKKADVIKKVIDANSKLSELITEIQNNKTEGVITYENGNTYTKVDYRIKKAREVFGFDIRIINSIIHRDDREVVVECNIYIKQNEGWDLVQNAHAHEVRDASYLNTYNYIEIAETSAMGRALAGLGLFGNEFASHNEIQSSVQHQQQNSSTGVVKKTTRNVVSKTNKIKKIKPEQIAYLQDYLNKNKGIAIEDILDGKNAKKIEDLTEEAAIEIIGYLTTNLDSPL